MSKKGYKQTEEHKEKIGISVSVATKGRKSVKYWLGKVRSEETKKKISVAHKGKKLSEKTKRRLSELNSKENHPNWKGGVSFNSKEYNKNYKKKNREKVNSLNRKRRIIKKGAIGSHTLGEWELLKKQYGYCCPSCKKCEPEITLSEDHIIPLSKGGSNNIENIQPLCRSCNSKKHTKIIKYNY